MIDFYFHATPNSMKVAGLLHELAVTFTVKPVDIFKGEQHLAASGAINPNGKVPAIVDGRATVFDSHAIQLYLVDKHGAFAPEDRTEHATMLSWLQLIATGLSPFRARQFTSYTMRPSSSPMQ